jgi:Fe-S cluster biogenesis protein NfuA
MKEKIEAAIAEVRPFLQRDGGDIDLVDVTDGIVKVRLRGACACCPGAQATLTQGVEKIIRQRVPEVKSVVSVPF